MCVCMSFLSIPLIFPQQAVSLVGAQLASQYGETEKKQAFEELITDAEWGIQLGKLGVCIPLFYLGIGNKYIVGPDCCVLMCT